MLVGGRDFPPRKFPPLGGIAGIVEWPSGGEKTGGEHRGGNFRGGTALVTHVGGRPGMDSCLANCESAMMFRRVSRGVLN